jgi:hypothetical protein
VDKYLAGINTRRPLIAHNVFPRMVSAIRDQQHVTADYPSPPRYRVKEGIGWNFKYGIETTRKNLVAARST